ncbi:TonB-dependent receptor plug domain-containing protein [Gloeobacter violaceus]|uniref:Glr1380 protein n=1 Tax=Gloeobacter violaceus (strain ATCC 29082 / PCC 7421) TaxID=251221 RepID=Q7NKU6_GLOVI|nr:TonB-dependent receptor [Gloeobacter violaceus]BAC89321.1 glr1380 [Gloeobacter violaceus PCC 7421]
MNTSSRLGGALAWAVLLPAFTAVPAAYAGPVATVAANSQTVSLEGAKALLDQSRGRAADLQARPALWDWTAPVTAQAPTPPPAPTPAEPAPADQPADETTDILDEVSVTATRRLTRQRDITATTYSVKREDFAAQGAQTATDALQIIPGFIGQPSLGGVRNAGGNFLRGFNDQRFLVLRDGLAQTFPQNGRSAVAQFLLDDLERIEVVTGGATLRYGSGSVGGVINLITETPKGLPKLTLEYQAGSYGFSRYLGKYGGGDDTFSYNFAFSSLVAFNNYPFKYTIPSSAQYYGPTVNQNSQVTTPNIDPSIYPNGTNSFGYGGPGDPDNSGAVDLFGFMKPELGPPITIQGIADSSYNAQDNYTAKLVFKPDPTNRLTLRANQANRNFDDQGPGANSFNNCITGFSADPNGTISGDRFVPLDRNGNEVACTGGQFAVGTATTQFQFGFPNAFNASTDGRVTFPTGVPYPAAEAAVGNILFFQKRNTANTDISFNWDYELTPTTSVNSYVYYLRQLFTTFRPSPYFINTNIFGIDPTGAGNLNRIDFQGATQPYSDGQKFEAQTALNWQLSPGQNLQFGVNFVEDRVNQQQSRGSSFFTRAIARTSIFLIDDISFSEQLKANIGLRWTSSSQFGEVLSPGVGVRYSPTNWISLRSNWSQVFNAPNIADLYVISGLFIDNPDLRPETGITYDVGIDLTPAPNLGFRFTYFSTYLNDTFTAITFVNPDADNPDSPTFQSPIVQQIQNIAGQRARASRRRLTGRLPTNCACGRHGRTRMRAISAW